MANAIYNTFKKCIMDGTHDLDDAGQTVKCMLVSSGYTPDVDTHDFIDDVNPYEITGTGYTAGGATLMNKTVIQDNVDDEGVWDADDVVWPDSTITAAGCVLYKDTGTASTSRLICYFDFQGDKSSSGGDFTVQWHAEGILNLT